MTANEGTLLKDQFLIEIRKDLSVLHHYPQDIGAVLFERCKNRIPNIIIPGISPTEKELSHIGCWAWREYINQM